MTTGTCSLVGDIGGTNARFATVYSGEVTPRNLQTLRCTDYDNLDAAIVDYLHRSGVKQVQNACLAVASPVQATRVRLTNNHWHFDSEALCRQFGWDGCRIINDFVAMALGVPHIGVDRLSYLCGGPGDARRPKLVIGPGTGLGVSALLPPLPGQASGWPLVTEGGHVDFAPTDDTDFAVLKILKARFGRVSAERILSGQGLVNLYQAHAAIQGVVAALDAPEKITAAALNKSDALAHQTLQHFCEILGRVAGNAVLTLGSTGGVYLCGGILPAMIEALSQGAFQRGFEDKGRMRPLLVSTPVYVVTDVRTGLFGAAAALLSPIA